MSDTQGVLLHYHGGEVYALPTADPHVWRVAGIEVHVDLVATHPVHSEVIGVEAFDTLAGAAKFQRFATGGGCALRPGEVDAAIANAEAVLAKYERPKAKRTGKAKGKAKGKSKRRVAAKGGR
jgi:hypothetical protein